MGRNLLVDCTMTPETFKILSQQLQELAPSIPLRWGAIQNDVSDSKINMFGCDTFEALKLALKEETEATKTYYKKRWFLWKCAQCDEYLFYKQETVQKNPNSRSQDWDFQLFNNKRLRFDLKGTVIPQRIKSKLKPNETPNAMAIINFYYNKQSRGVRDHIQNRLFIVHHPLKDENENKMRANFQAKETIYKSYIEWLQLKSPHFSFFIYEKVLVDVLYLKELPDGALVSKFLRT